MTDNDAYERIVARALKADDGNESNSSQLNGALVSIDPRTGEVLALVGGVDYAKSAFNRVDDPSFSASGNTGILLRRITKAKRDFERDYTYAKASVWLEKE